MLLIVLHNIHSASRYTHNASNLLTFADGNQKRCISFDNDYCSAKRKLDHAV